MGLRMRKFELNVLWDHSFWFTYFVSLGYGTTHKVSNLILQEGTANIGNFLLNIRRSFQPILNEGPRMPAMSSKKQICPCQLEFPSNDEKDFLSDATEHSTFLWSFMRCHLLDYKSFRTGQDSMYWCIQEPFWWNQMSAILTVLMLQLQKWVQSIR